MSRAPKENLQQSQLLATQEVRLEVLKLAYRHDKDEQTIIDRCVALEQYVMQGRTASAPGAD
jgi:hypothetical protein